MKAAETTSGLKMCINAEIKSVWILCYNAKVKAVSTESKPVLDFTEIMEMTAFPKAHGITIAYKLSRMVQLRAGNNFLKSSKEWVS